MLSPTLYSFRYKSAWALTSITSLSSSRSYPGNKADNSTSASSGRSGQRHRQLHQEREKWPAEGRRFVKSQRRLHGAIVGAKLAINKVKNKHANKDITYSITSNQKSKSHEILSYISAQKQKAAGHKPSQSNLKVEPRENINKMHRTGAFIATIAIQSHTHTHIEHQHNLLDKDENLKEEKH